MMSERRDCVGIGILGCANIARKNIRAIQLAGESDIVVTAVASRSKEKAEAFIKDNAGLAGATAFGSYDELLADKTVDAIYLPLPAGLHVEWVKKAAAAGKHVLCEKPISLTVEAAEEIISVCEQAGVQFMDGTMWVHNPRAEEMAGAIRRELGQLKSVTSAFAFPAPEAFLKDDVRCKPELDGLGALGDLGWYCTRASLWAFDYDPPSAVQAHAGALKNEAGVLMHVGATLTWPDGRRASFECSFDRAPVQQLEARFHYHGPLSYPVAVVQDVHAGDKGVLELSDFVIPMREGEAAYRLRDAAFLAELDIAVTQRTTEHMVPVDRQQEVLMWQAFAASIRAIRAGRPPQKQWPQQSLLTQRVLCAIAESAASDCRIVRL